MTEEENEKIKRLIATKDITNIKLAYILGKDSDIINEYRKAIYFYKDFLHLFGLHGHGGKVFKITEEIIFLNLSSVSIRVGIKNVRFIKL